MFITFQKVRMFSSQYVIYSNYIFLSITFQRTYGSESGFCLKNGGIRLLDLKRFQNQMATIKRCVCYILIVLINYSNILLMPIHSLQTSVSSILK